MLVVMNLPPLSLIHKKRKELGLSQTLLAKKAKVSQSLIARVEAGAVDPRYSKIERIFKALNEYKAGKRIAANIMTENVISLKPYDNLRFAAETMKNHAVSQVPVLENNACVGSISEKKILEQLSNTQDVNTLSKEYVKTYMEEAFPQVNLKTPLSAVSPLLEHQQAVIVTEKGGVKGIITKSDLLTVMQT
ncbi:MAG: CBS domain-containing protein [Candidatus Altiarchaeales archaeon]|nr:CBS domain-containing protein [Candidatus Altiarchaeales archaeon]